MAALAAEAGLSDAHFARAFRTTFGEPPHRLVLRWRLERAERLIARAGLAPAEAALAAGFHDQSHLTNTMRRHLGTTPGARAAQVVRRTAASVTPAMQRNHDDGCRRAVGGGCGAA